VETLLSGHSPETLLSGHSPIKEPKLEAAISRAVAAGRLRASTDPTGLVAWGDASLICIGTPNSADGIARLDALVNVTDEIGRQLADGTGEHLVIVRSTVFPGTVRGKVRETLEVRSGRVASEGFGGAMIPEFLRETSAVNDFYAPPFTVVVQSTTVRAPRSSRSTSRSRRRSFASRSSRPRWSSSRATLSMHSRLDSPTRSADLRRAQHGQPSGHGDAL
jgi:UDP-glucose 6-dehydrogenase